MVFNGSAKNNYTELKSRYLLTRYYKLSATDKKVPVIKNWLGREDLQFVHTNTVRTRSMSNGKRTFRDNK